MIFLDYVFKGVNASFCHVDNQQDNAIKHRVEMDVQFTVDILPTVFGNEHEQPSPWSKMESPRTQCNRYHRNVFPEYLENTSIQNIHFFPGASVYL